MGCINSKVSKRKLRGGDLRLIPVKLINPLTIEEILENVFRHCDLAALNTSRLVNKTWHHVSLPFWLDRGPPLKLHNAYPRRLADVQLSKLVQDASSSDPMDYAHFGIRQYKKFELHLHKLRDSQRRQLSQFWSGWGSTLSVLNLHAYCVEMDAKLFVDLLSCRFTPNLEILEAQVRLRWEDYMQLISSPPDLIPVLLSDNMEGRSLQANPKLKSLKLHILFPYTITERDNTVKQLVLPVNWNQQLLCYPNLEHLAVRFSIDYCREELDRMLKAIAEIRIGDRQKLALKTLDIRYSQTFPDERIPLSFRHLLVDTGLALESLNFCFGETTPLEVIHDSLYSQRKTLKRLDLYRCRPFRNFRFPIMSSLRHLTLRGQPFKNFGWLKALPNLETLKLEKANRDKISLEATAGKWMDELVLGSLTTFHCDYYFEWDADEIENFATWMPNLENLRLDLGNETFHLVPLYWPRLTKLQIIGDHLDDSGITGLSTVQLDSKTVQVVHYPFNITDLKELRSFSMEQFFCGRSHLEARVTKASVFYGFLKCPRLERIDVQILVKNGSEMQVIDKIMTERIPYSAIGYATTDATSDSETDSDGTT